MLLSLAQVNRGLTDKALRLGVLGVKTDAKPGQTKEKARDLACLRTSGVRKVSRIARQGGKEEFGRRQSLRTAGVGSGFRLGGTVTE